MGNWCFSKINSVPRGLFGLTLMALFMKIRAQQESRSKAHTRENSRELKYGHPTKRRTRIFADLKRD